MSLWVYWSGRQVMRRRGHLSGGRWRGHFGPVYRSGQLALVGQPDVEHVLGRQFGCGGCLVGSDCQCCIGSNHSDHARSLVQKDMSKSPVQKGATAMDIPSLASIRPLIKWAALCWCWQRRLPGVPYVLLVVAIVCCH